jgi:predicted ThiF/HesA family dinucleotide-utilizing enzyme
MNKYGNNGKQNFKIGEVYDKPVSAKSAATPTERVPLDKGATQHLLIQIPNDRRSS